TALLLACTLLITLPSPSAPSPSPSPSPTQACHSLTFRDNQAYATCNDLLRLNSYLYWNYYPANQTADIAFRKPETSTSNWIAWALNPGGQMMAGPQALVAYQDSDGNMVAYATPVSGTPTMKPGNLSFGVSNLRAEYSGGEMIIYATLQQDSTLLSTNHVWQEGPVRGGSPRMHDLSEDNMLSFGTLNFASGTVTSPSSTGGGINSKALLKNLGMISTEPAKLWPFVLVSPDGESCQSRNQLFKTQKYWHSFASHGSCSVSALIRKSNPNNKYRIYWTIYHHSLALSSFKITNGHNYWKRTYAGTIIALGAVGLLLEIFTWLVVIRRKKFEATNTQEIGANGGH
ncbi:hypothetical protein Tsubulata_025106, partial [Turnera subulata]